MLRFRIRHQMNLIICFYIYSNNAHFICYSQSVPSSSFCCTEFWHKFLRIRNPTHFFNLLIACVWAVIFHLHKCDLSPSKLSLNFCFNYISENFHFYESLNINSPYLMTFVYHKQLSNCVPCQFTHFTISSLQLSCLFFLITSFS